MLLTWLTIIPKFAHSKPCVLNIPYSAKFWRGKIMANRSLQTFGEEKRWRIANNIISYFSESGIWLGKILTNDVQFAKFAKVFPRQNFALYGISISYIPVRVSYLSYYPSPRRSRGRG